MFNLSSANTNDASPDSKQALAEQIQEIQTLVVTDKSYLKKLISILTDAYRDAKELQEKRPKEALKIIDTSITQIFALNNILQDQFADPDTFHYWSTNVNLLSTKNNLLKTTITNQLLLATLAKQNDHFAFDNLWNYDTLQEPHHLETFEHIALPVIQPTLSFKTHQTILLEGDKNTGKSYTIHKIKDKLEELHIPCQFYSVSGVEFETKIDTLQQVVLQDPTMHNFFVTELPPFEMQMNWTTQHMSKWYLSLEKDAFHNTTWIILCRSHTMIPEEVIQLLKPKMIRYHSPNANTIQIYIERLIKEMYHIHDFSELPSHVSLPIIDETAEFAKLCVFLEKQHYDYDRLLLLLRNALKYNLALAIRENAIYLIDGQYYLKNSLQFPLKVDYQYYVISDSQQDLLTFPQEGNPSTLLDYWNVHVLDKMDSVEDHRFVGLWVHSPSTSTTKRDMDVIAAFEVKSSEYSYHVNAHIQFLYKNLIHWYLQLWKNIFNSERTISTKYSELAKMMDYHRAEIFSVYDDESLFLLDSEILREIFFTPEEYVTVYRKGFIDELNAFTVTNKQYIVYNSPSLTSTSGFHLAYGKEHKFVQASVNAEEMQRMIKSLTQRDNQVSKIQLEDGFVWCVELEGVLEYKLMSIKSENTDDYTSVFCGLEMTEEITLPDNYCITNEADLDVLSETFPADFKKCYRDETETWLLYPLQKHHITYLQRQYTNEQLFYIRLYFHCLQIKDPLLSEAQTSEMMELIDNLRNQIDYLFLLTPTTDDDRENGTWSVSKNHPHKNEMESKFYSLERKVVFTVNPYYCIQLLYSLSKEENQLISLRQVLHEYLQVKQSPVLQNHMIYVKSTITKQEWTRAVAMEVVPIQVNDKFINSGVYGHVRSLRKSLYFQLMKNATLVGTVESVERDTAQTLQIKWYRFRDDPSLNQLVTLFRKKHNLYEGDQMDKKSYLYSLIQLSVLDQDIAVTKAFFATLLIAPLFYTREPVQPNLLEHVQRGEIVQNILRFFSIPATKLQLLEYVQNTDIPRKIDDKHILPREQLSDIKYIYGLKASHLESQHLLTTHTI